MVPCIYVHFLLSVCFSIFNMALSLVARLFIPCFGYADRMAFYGSANGTCHHTLNLASTAWVLYFPAHDLVSSWVVFIGPAINNIVEY